ncbi:MAG: glutamyl-tRNA reductase [Dehalococcoidia bacterium]
MTKNLLVTCVGLNHVTSPIEERETLAFTRDELRELLPRIAPELDGAVILSTSNPTEIYTTAPAGEGPDLIRLLNDAKGAAVSNDHFYVLQHAAAVAQLFRVASGIDSMVLGESQILGQVREAMSIATDAETLNGTLSHVFHSAIHVGKRARSETNIGSHAVSVGSAAVSLAKNSLGDLTGKTVLVISAGSMGKLAARALAQQTRSHILVANRTRGRAAQLAQQLGPDTEAIDFDHLDEALATSDIVISGTSAEGFILRPDDVRPVMDARADRSLLFIDIAVPRDIDPAVRDIAGVHLCDIDDIEAVTNEGWSGRQAEVEKVEGIVGAEVAAFEDWWRSLDVVPVISALRQRAEAIRVHEVERTLGKMKLNNGDRERIEAMTAAIVKKMLDRPIARLKDGADKGLYMEALEDLFDIHGSSNGRRHGAGH